MNVLDEFSGDIFAKCMTCDQSKFAQDPMLHLRLITIDVIQEWKRTRPADLRAVERGMRIQRWRLRWMRVKQILSWGR